MLSRLLVVLFGVPFAGKNIPPFRHSLEIMVLPHQLRDLQLPKLLYASRVNVLQVFLTLLVRAQLNII